MPRSPVRAMRNTRSAPGPSAGWLEERRNESRANAAPTRVRAVISGGRVRSVPMMLILSISLSAGSFWSLCSTGGSSSRRPVRKTVATPAKSGKIRSP